MSDERVAPDRPDSSPSTARARMSPKARRLAREQGLDPSLVQGSGVDGAILADDVFRAAADAARSRAEAERAVLIAAANAERERLAAAAVAERERLAAAAAAERERLAAERDRIAAAAAADLARLERERVVADAEHAERERRLAAELASARDARGRAEADVARLEAERIRLETERVATEAMRSSSRHEHEDAARDVVPQLVVGREFDASALVALCGYQSDRVGQLHGLAITHLDVVVAAVGRALRQHPHLNACWAGTGIVHRDATLIGLVVQAGDDEVVVVIRDADHASVADVARRRHDLVARAESRQLSESESTDATFTVSHLGTLSLDVCAAPLIGAQAGHLAVGAVADRVVAIGGLIGVKPMMSLTLSCDHRIVHTARAAAFLNDVVIALSAPNTWM